MENYDCWGSLQNIHQSGNYETRCMEAAYSEPDLGSRALPPNGSSPFRRWGQSSFRAPRPTEPHPSLSRRPSSLAASDNDVYTKSMENFVDDLQSVRSHSADLDLANCGQNNNNCKSSSDIGTAGGVNAWGNSFEKLLEDPAGLHTFAEFLKKEFSAENIYFWTACERYRQIDSDTDRATHAMDIYSKHLANGALEPVNVDSQARSITDDNLHMADRNLFSQAQKQIFNLMKFDSYQRFIRSDLYKRCIEAEEKKQPLPYPAEQLDELLKTNLLSPGPSKLKKSASNAEDRRRKSLLPWHRKTRCKSRDRTENELSTVSKTSTLQKSQQLSGNSLKLPMTNSASDIHSSRSSLSSFDTTAAAVSDDPKTCSLCRVILSDGATTIVQTRPNETVRQLVDRLLEKRGIQYSFFDVLFNGSSKSIDLESASCILAGREVQIEQRVSFKLDLPDPKVISVKSKPKKALHEVIKPILQKYNYRMEDVQVLLRDTHEQLDLLLPVTVADNQRLQIVMLHGYQNHQAMVKSAPVKNTKMGPPAAVVATSNGGTSQQSTLDEITNKVFSELLQGKVEAQTQKIAPDQCSLRSDDCASETSSIFERLRRRDSSIPGLRALRPKKVILPTSKGVVAIAPSVAASDDTLSTSTQVTGGSDPTGIKKPLIAKWKTGVKVQVTERTDKPDEFIEGLKRAQRARLEDQRGVEINFELPDFLKDKENLSAANKLRKIRANLSPVNKSESTDAIPQPAPRFSLTKSQSVSPMKIDSSPQETSVESFVPNTSNSSNDLDIDSSSSSRGPPPLPPKPKVLPIKPSNWGQNNSTASTLPSKIPVDVGRGRHLAIAPDQVQAGSSVAARNAYLDQPSSSFV